MTARISRKALRDMAATVGATDVTQWHMDELTRLRSTTECVAVSVGTYGMSAGLFVDDRGRFYVVPGRSTALFVLR